MHFCITSNYKEKTKHFEISAMYGLWLLITYTNSYSVLVLRKIIMLDDSYIN